MSETEIFTPTLETLSYQVNENFLKEKQLHEFPIIRRNTANNQEVMEWMPIWVESIEVIGGVVYLGLRDVFNFNSDQVTGEVKGFDLGQAVRYENLMLYPRIQKIGTAIKINQDRQAVRQENTNDSGRTTDTPTNGGGANG